MIVRCVKKQLLYDYNDVFGHYINNMLGNYLNKFLVANSIKIPLKFVCFVGVN